MSTTTAVSAGLDARPVTRYTLHCSHCAKPMKDGEFDSIVTWTPEALADIGSYEIDGYETNVDGHALVCPDCMIGYCEHCIDKVYAWQEHEGDVGGGVVWHTGCPTPEESAT